MRRARDRDCAAGIGPALCRAHQRERDSRRRRRAVGVCGRSVHSPAPGPLHPLPATDQPGQADWRALPREQPDLARLPAGPDHGAEAARLAGGDLAGKQPPVPRPGGTGGEDPAPRRRQYHRRLHPVDGGGRADHRGQ